MIPQNRELTTAEFLIMERMCVEGQTVYMVDGQWYIHGMIPISNLVASALVSSHMIAWAGGCNCYLPTGFGIDKFNNYMFWRDVRGY